jgi:Fe-S-cluster containining protein
MNSCDDKMSSDHSHPENSDEVVYEPEMNEEILCRIELLKTLQESFQCKRCGECCKQEAIAFTESDVKNASQKMELSPLEFIERYGPVPINIPDNLKYYQLSTGTDGMCPFNHDHECTIYDARPQVCRGFPFLTPKNVQNAFQMNDVILLGGICQAAIDQAERIYKYGARPRDEETNPGLKPEKWSDTDRGG